MKTGLLYTLNIMVQLLVLALCVISIRYIYSYYSMPDLLGDKKLSVFYFIVFFSCFIFAIGYFLLRAGSEKIKYIKLFKFVELYSPVILVVIVVFFFTIVNSGKL